MHQREPSFIDRRSFLAGAGAAFLAGLGPRSAEALERTQAVFGAACQRPDGRFACAVFTESGEIVTTIDLPDRGHDVAVDPAGRHAVVFARRPRSFAVVFDPLSGRTLRTIHSEPGRHFFGHGFFSPDGQLLYATENEFDAARGLIGIYEVENGFRRVAEFDTHGMDTHEALLMADGVTIVVANGGIETHPDFGRQKLNLATMEPSLVFIDRASGRLLEKHVLPADLHQLSIRHLAVDADNRVWFGCQYEGPSINQPPLVGLVQPGGSVSLVAMEPQTLASLSNYVGSIASSRDGRRIALASPVGGTVLVLDAAERRPVGRFALADGCGLAPSPGGFVATSGRGDIVSLPSGSRPRASEDLLWDNHILAL